MSSTDAVLDSNVLLRLLLEDDPELSARARNFLDTSLERGDRLHVSLTTLSEVVFVITGARLKMPPADALQALDAMFAMPLWITDRTVAVRARDLYESFHDWDDCVVVAQALRDCGGRVVTFDRGMRRIPGIQWIHPSGTT